MSSFFGKFRGNGANSTSSANGTAASKKDSAPLPKTPLQKLLSDAGPLKSDGSDKFFGMENAPFANTCYCNSILQCLYYSAPFRESVINYPQRSPPESLKHALSTNFKYPDPDISLEEALLQTKLKQQQLATSNGVRPTLTPQNQIPKAEDKDSPEYKKKVAMHTLPVLETTDNSQNYGMQESLFTSLKDIFESIAASEERVGVVRPQHFLDVLRRENEMFRTAMHQDAHEFLNLLLNEVVNNVEAEANRTSVLEADADSESSTATSTSVATTLATSVGGSAKTPPYSTRWVHELFEGKLTSETECLTCEKKSQRDEAFLDLSVDLEQHSSVTSCLRKFSQEEMLCERNKFHCDNCGGLQEAEKRMKIKRLPRILALHLKRFKYTEDQQRLQKLFHRVVYPYYLRLFNTTDDAEDPDRLYELYAVVVHIGGGPYHGHYVAIIKTEDRGWLLFDDEMVEPVDKSYVRNFFGDKPGQACAYVLFYQETTFEAMQREMQSDERMSAASKSQDADLAPMAALDLKTTGTQPIPTQPQDISRVRSAIPQLPTTDSSTAGSYNPIKLIPSAPQLSNIGDAPPTALPTTAANSQPATAPTPSSSKLPISLPRIPLMSRTPDRAAEIQSKKERAREEKDRKAQERETQKQKRKEQEKADARLRELAKKEEQQIKSALDASKLTAKEEKKRLSSEKKRLSSEGASDGATGNGSTNANGNGNTNGIANGFTNGINGIAGGLGRLKLGSRTLSYSRKHKDNSTTNKDKVPDLPTTASASAMNGNPTASDVTITPKNFQRQELDTSSSAITDTANQPSASGPASGSGAGEQPHLAARVLAQAEQEDFSSSQQQQPQITSLPQPPPAPSPPKQPTTRRSRFSLRKKSFSVL
ncbi:Ubiquitin carboxyl-terminal hydrolase [Trichophyton interdigitale]|uniref:ubiquitinyl hydrolase 1 n=1 Tax=Trichophyton interdigitale TaxID=101480 RepID=A0A9P4YKB8_9EURO|nr:Ubiquitin carboxyl-terminal hydrolase [Trichophyton interdigitale]KAG5208114.1 Ubiquitin carboxyl-terminal hydrolase [Trichophyton interdigitale]KAG8210189.1 Ubiquitin carboxyl-terminal hydrolase [Trichophyton interdigitale]